jgi:hypothetical protein
MTSRKFRGQPTMTIQALAFRAGDHFSQFAKRNEIQRPPLGRPQANVNQNDAGAF